MNVQNRTIFSNDNLPVLRGIDTEPVDLIYLDPPFNSNRNYAAPIGSEAAGAAFKDTWTLSDVDNAWHGEIADREPALYQVIHAVELTHGKGMKSYLIMMAVRLLKMERVLKNTGSIYLPCAPTASHYLKMLMDSVFGKNNFKNEVVWNSATGVKNNVKTRFGRGHDIIFFYGMPASDHIVPQSQGGTDHEDNLQLLCGACNSTKGRGTQAELISRLKAQGVLR